MGRDRGQALRRRLLRDVQEMKKCEDVPARDEETRRGGHRGGWDTNGRRGRDQAEIEEQEYRPEQAVPPVRGTTEHVHLSQSPQN